MRMPSNHRRTTKTPGKGKPSSRPVPEKGYASTEEAAIARRVLEKHRKALAALAK